MNKGQKLRRAIQCAVGIGLYGEFETTFAKGGFVYHLRGLLLSLCDLCGVWSNRFSAASRRFTVSSSE